MHKWRKWVIGPFKQKCIYEWFKQEVYPLHFKQNLKVLKEEKYRAIEEQKKRRKIKQDQINVLEPEPKENYKNSEIPIDPDEDLLI